MARQTFTWKAIYTDGSVLAEYMPDGSKHSQWDIDRARLKQFVLCKHDGSPVVAVHLDGQKRLIYRLRHAVPFTGLRAGTNETVYIVGWQETRRGVNVQMVCFVFEDGHVEVVDRFREGHPWFYPVQFRAEEKNE